MEQWNDGPPWSDSVLIASSGLIAWIIAKRQITAGKYPRYMQEKVQNSCLSDLSDIV
jgi:hypothetical protein